MFCQHLQLKANSLTNKHNEQRLVIFSKFLKQSAAVFCEMMSCTIIVISDWRSRATVGTTSETHQSLQKGWWPTRAICRFFNLVQKQTMTLQIFSFQIDFAQNFYNMSENDWVAQVKAPPKIKTRSLQESLDVLFEIPQYLYSVNDWGKNNWKQLTTKYN